MTAEQVIDFFAPQQSSVNIVREWLVSAGIAADRIGHSVNKQVGLSQPSPIISK